MKKYFFVLSFLSLTYLAIAPVSYTIIPYPNNLIEKEGFIEFKGELITAFKKTQSYRVINKFSQVK